MTRINYDDFTGYPNSDMDKVILRNKSVPVNIRFQIAIRRRILGYGNNRKVLSASISYKTLMEMTGASRSQIKRAIKEITKDPDNPITVTRGNGRGNENIYHLDLTKMGYGLSFDVESKPLYRKGTTCNEKLQPEVSPLDKITDEELLQDG